MTVKIEESKGIKYEVRNPIPPDSIISAPQPGESYSSEYFAAIIQRQNPNMSKDEAQSWADFMILNLQLKLSAKKHTWALAVVITCTWLLILLGFALANHFNIL